MSYIYLAEPIDQAPEPISAPVVAELEAFKLNYYSPRRAWAWKGDMDGSIQAVNDAALLKSDLVLACFQQGLPSLGVPMECERAFNLGIPVVVWADFARVRSGVFADGRCTWYQDAHKAVAEAKMLTSMTRTKLSTEAASRWIAGSTRTDIDSGPLQARWTSMSSNAQVPRTGKPGDAGYDLVCSMRTRILPGSQGSVPCGIAVQLPDGYWGLVQGRSSSWRRGLSVKASIIDAGYRGELWADCLNIGRKAHVVEEGERIAQLIPIPLALPMEWVQAELDPSERGDSGYGSTGK